MQRGARTERRCLRVIDVIPQHVEGVVHAAPEVEAVQVLSEVLPPAHIQQVAGELVKALQLCSGGGKGKGGKGRLASCKSQRKAQGWQEACADQSQPTLMTCRRSTSASLKCQVRRLFTSSFTHIFIPSSNT